MHVAQLGLFPSHFSFLLRHIVQAILFGFATCAAPRDSLGGVVDEATLWFELGGRSLKLISSDGEFDPDMMVRAMLMCVVRDSSKR